MLISLIIWLHSFNTYEYVSYMLWWSVPNNLGLLTYTPNLLVPWVGFIPQWEVQEAIIDVADGFLVLLWHQTTLILAQPRRVLSSLALFLKSEQDFLLPRIYVSSLLSCLTSQNFSTLLPTSHPLFISLSQQWGCHDKRIFRMLMGPSISYHWSEGTHFLLLTWPLSNSCLALVIARQTDSPKALSLDHGMS